MKNIAVITGASSGMGKEFVKQLDNEGFDEIWGIALEGDDLKALTKEIKTKMVPFAIDLTDSNALQKYKEALEKEKPNILWLANCSGYCKFGDYSQIPLDISVNMTELNCIALMKMTEMALPYMTEGAKIIEIASMAALQSTPFMNVYGASKAFVLSYSRGLNIELKPRKISVTCMCPLWTKTRFFDTAKKTSKKAVSHFSSMYTASKVVAKGIKDARKRKVVSIYGCKAKFQAAIVKMLPHSWVVSIWTRQQKKQQKKNKE